MKKSNVVAIAIAGLVLLEIVALSHGINGTLFRIVVGAITGMVGYLYGKFEPGAGVLKKFLPAVLLCLCLASCAGVPIVVDVCYVHPEYGKICASWDGKNVKITSDVKLPPELEAQLDEWIRKLK